MQPPFASWQAPGGADYVGHPAPGLRVDIADNGLIFVECKRLGRLDGPKGQDERTDAINQLRSYIRAHVDQAAVKPKTVVGVVRSIGDPLHVMPFRGAV
jgi:hypothetical protein